MIGDGEKESLHSGLRALREDMLGKLDGLGEYDVRRPLTATGTNLLGLVKHVASVELGYLTETFGRPAGRDLPWSAPDAEVNADMWATPDESREQIVELYRYTAARADETIEELPLDAPGEVPWWPPERNRVTLHQIIVRVLAETARHAGHADIVRELIDGAAGRWPGDPSIPFHDEAEWARYRERLEAAARAATT
jgi:hypothetical protein